MNDQLDKANQAASWFETFIQAHPAVVAIVLAIVCSWTVTLTVKRVTPAGKWKGLALFLIDVGFAFGICAVMWPDSHPWLWALLVGTSSPIVYRGVTALIGWKWPAAKRFFTLRELDGEDDTSTGDDTRIPPGDTPQ